MFVVFNKNKKIIGYHSDEDVVFEYTYKYNKYSDIDEAEYKFIKDKKFYKYIKEHKSDDKKYLLKFNNTYVPEKYIDSESLSDTGFIKEVKCAKDTIDTLMSCYDQFNDKELKQLMKTYKILDNVIRDAENYTADLEVLQRNKDHISELCDSDTWLRYDI